MRSRRTAAAVALLALALTAGACTDESDEPDPAPSAAPAPVDPAELTLGVYGTDEEIAAYQGVVDTYNAETEIAEVSVESWADHDSFEQDLRAGEPLPDVFMVSQRDLAYLQDNELNRPVDELLDERGVELGDGYSREALEAFSDDRALQCMPYAISPMVVYYNTAMVDFERMAERELDVPASVLPEASNPHSGWTFEEFRVAADFASRPNRNTKGFSVEPTLEGLAPYVLSGGGQLFDDEDEPRSLAFSSDDTRSSLEASLPVLRDPLLTLSPEQLERDTPLGWFKRGRLAMVTGYRSLVPDLRAVEGLEFDVLPMPVVEDAATLGEITGICLSEDATDIPAAADLLVGMVSTEAVQAVVRAGYLAPANAAVALSEDFLQPGLMPEHAGVFTGSVRALRTLPLSVDLTALESVVGPPLDELLNVDVLDLDAVTDTIDLASLSVLDPELAPEATASASAEAQEQAEQEAQEELEELQERLEDSE